MTVRAENRSRRGEDDAGDTLIEVLIALVILSITVVALISAFTTSVAASAQYRNIAVTDSIVRTLSEEVIAQFQQGTAYIACPNGTPANYTNGFGGSSPLSGDLAIPAPYTSAGYSASITAVGYWTGSNFDGTTSTCSTGSTVPEELTVTISGPSGSSEALTFIVEGSGQIFSTAPIPLDPPTNVVLTTPTTDSGGLTVSFTSSANAPATTSTFTQYYTVVACTNSAMSLGCTPPVSTFLSGQEITGLAPGTPYWVGVSANASPGYLGSTEATAGPQDSSGTALLPTVLSVEPSTTTAGALVVTFTPPTNVPSGETYTATACTDSAMSQGCVSVSGFTSGSQITGLSPGTPPYYVEVSANPNGSYTGATSLVYTPPVASTVQLDPPTGVSVASSTTQSGALVVNFNLSANAPSGQSYTVTGCTNSSMSQGCVSQTNYTPNQQFVGLVAGSSYYVTVTAVASKGYLAATSAVPTNPTMASIQLSPPTIKSVTAPNRSVGTLKVSFSGSPNAPRNETYSLLACLDSAMTQGCVPSTVVSSSSSVSGTISGLTSGQTYYVTVSADATSGYLASNPSASATGVPN